MKREVAAGVLAGVLFFAFLSGFNLVPVLLFSLLAYFLYEMGGLRVIRRRLGGDDGQIISNVTFQQIGGQAAAKKELMEALEFMKAGNKAELLGIRPLKGILLVGPPGTGKTLLAKAAATYTDAVFLTAAGSEFIEMYAGVGAQRVRSLFQRARDVARREGRSNAIIFIDEIDVLGGRRGQYQGHMEYDQTLNQLLTEMDGIKTTDGFRILVVGATNREDMLDPALLRPGRFDRVVRVDLPDQEGRLQILQLHTANKPLGPDVDLKQIARETFGFSGAHLESLANEAAILALREDKKEIEQRHFLEAIDKVSLGEKLDRRPQKEELRRVAVHEVGHAVVSETFRPGSVAAVTITSRGQALGYMRQVPQDDYYLYTEDQLRGQLRISLAGMAAEEVLLGNRSTGAQGDLEQAINTAKRMVAAGMSHLGIVSLPDLPEAELQAAIREILNEEKAEARRIIAEKKELIADLARELMEKERLEGDELRARLRGGEAVCFAAAQESAGVLAS
ncbi:MAG: vesicle-fusing ATPase [Bacillota bacterium]|jgi:vesicle-fusing ATPase|nr:vesicle-fusing ATPase [Bacillota bacterium]